MGIRDPKGAQGSKPLQEAYQEGEAFKLVGGRIVEANSREFGPGEMAVLEVETSAGNVEQFTIWGRYIVEQIRDIEPGDVPGMFTVERRVIDGYSDRPVKCLAPASATGDDDSPF